VALARLEHPSLTRPVEVRPGEAVRIVGPNGAGKTGLLRRLAGLESPWSPAQGSVAGQDPVRAPAAWLREQVGFVREDPRRALVGLTVGGEARFHGRPIPPGAVADQESATLSSGEARRLMLALTDAPLLLFDEPVEGLDDAAVAALRRRIEARGERGVVFVDHGDQLADLADRTVRLGPTEAVLRPRFPPAGPEVRLRRPAQDVDLGGRTLHLPALALPTGLHLVRGPNGAGKSTLLRQLAGLDGAPGTWDGAPLRPGSTVRLALPRSRDQLTQETVAAELEGLSDDATALVPEALRDRHPLSLSAGEARRVALARVLGRPAPVLLQDEPEAHLDSAGRSLLLHLLAARAEEACVVVASHDPLWDGVDGILLEAP